MNKSEQLIACLEGEIAKRDETIARLEPQLNRAIQANYDLREELAACRIAVENCELFRARIAELEAGRDSHQRHVMLTNLLARIHRDGGQYMKQHGMDKAFADADAIVAELYAALVSEAKAQGVVMPERWNVPRPMWKDARQPYGSPLNHADIEAAEKFNLALDEVARLNAAPEAPAADASDVLEQAMYTLISIGYHENSGLVHELRQALAACRSTGVV